MLFFIPDQHSMLMSLKSFLLQSLETHSLSPFAVYRHYDRPSVPARFPFPSLHRKISTALRDEANLVPYNFFIIPKGNSSQDTPAHSSPSPPSIPRTTTLLFVPSAKPFMMLKADPNLADGVLQSSFDNKVVHLGSTDR